MQQLPKIEFTLKPDNKSVSRTLLPLDLKKFVHVVDNLWYRVPNDTTIHIMLQHEQYCARIGTFDFNKTDGIKSHDISKETVIKHITETVKFPQNLRDYIDQAIEQPESELLALLMHECQLQLMSLIEPNLITKLRREADKVRKLNIPIQGLIA